MNKTVKKFAALFLALAMMLTLLPGAAFAQGEGETPAFAGTMHVLTGPSDALEESGDMTNSIVGTMQNNSFGLRFRTADGAAVAGETLAPSPSAQQPTTSTWRSAPTPRWATTPSPSRWTARRRC